MSLYKRAMRDAANRPKKHFHVMVKPTGAVCNLDCTYCYYLSKESLYPGSHFRMSDDVLEAYVRQMLEAHEVPEVQIAFQGGEPTLMEVEFFERAVELVHRFRKPNQTVSFSLQTNGTRIDEAWCDFFCRHNFLVGLSIDGPKDVHDTYRLNKGGRGTFDQVVAAWRLLQKHRVEVNVLCTVHAANQDRGLEVYKFFRDDLGAGFIQTIPIVERATPETLPLAEKGWHEKPGGERPLYEQTGSLVTGRSVHPAAYGKFLCDVFDEWIQKDVGHMFVQLFDVTLGSYLDIHSLCVFAPTCGKAVALEHNGDLYSCDHFVEPRFKLGNILQDKMASLLELPVQQRFGADKKTRLPKVCRECDVRFACNGGCPKDRFTNSPDGEPGLNYLCPSYLAFFHHVDPAMTKMAELVRKGRPASEIMSIR